VMYCWNSPALISSPLSVRKWTTALCSIWTLHVQMYVENVDMALKSWKSKMVGNSTWREEALVEMDMDLICSWQESNQPGQGETLYDLFHRL
jgi:hypothetical protein